MNILLVDDHALFAKSLEIALEDYPEIERIQSTQNIDYVISDIQKKKPDIVLMDINLNNISSEDGLLITKNILNIIPDMKILILTGYDLPVYRYEAQKIGAKGFVNKNIEPEELLKVLKIVQQGGRFFPAEDKNIEELTESERKILQLLSKGIKRKEIAAQLYLSERTISNHLQNIFDKLDVSSSIEAVTKAIQMGYITPVY